MQKHLIHLLVILGLLIVACNENDNSNPLGDDRNGSSDGKNSSKTGFGVSGLLFENNLVMWDCENQGSRSELFPQMYFTRADAANFPVFGSFPTNFLVSGGVPRDGIPALGNYRSEQALPLFPLQTRSLDTRFAPKHTVLGLIEGNVQKAYPFSRLAARPVINDNVNGRDVLIVSDPSSKLAIPYDRSVNGLILNFKISSENPFQMIDNETGSVWNLKGEALSGALTVTKLRQIPAYNAFWFAWAVMWPSTQIFE